MNDEGEQRMDDEWTKEEIMEDVIEYYKDKDRHMIELVGNLREEVERLREGRLDLINEVIRIINNKTGERVDADLHDYIIDRLVNE